MATIDSSEFFSRKRDTSEIKSEILNKYFKTWAGILLFGQKIRSINRLIYVDLYAGQGCYDDGSPSTPIKILESIYKSSGTKLNINDAVQCFFNDCNKELSVKLEENIRSLPFYNQLRHKPVILNEEADKELLFKLLNKGVPSLTFLDPFGYKGLSEEVLLRSVQEWGSDLFMLFNVNRVRSAVMNDIVAHLMLGLFGKKKFDEIRSGYNSMRSASKREEFLVRQFESLFEEKGYLTFKFKINFPGRKQTSHYLIFVSKVRIAYQRMKEIMTQYSEFQEDGVPLFGVNINYKPSLFNTYSLRNLVFDLLARKKEFGRLSIENIYEVHHVNTNYIKENYKNAFSELLNENKIQLIDKNNKETRRLTYTAIVEFI